jgi:hypothetical protein
VSRDSWTRGSDMCGSKWEGMAPLSCWEATETI